MEPYVVQRVNVKDCVYSPECVTSPTEPRQSCVIQFLLSHMLSTIDTGMSESVGDVTFVHS